MGSTERWDMTFHTLKNEKNTRGKDAGECSVLKVSVRKSLLEKLFETFCSKHFVQNILFKTFCLKHFVWNILFETFCSKHFVWNILFETFCSKHFVRNILFKTFCSKHFCFNSMSETFCLYASNSSKTFILS
jgi:hypothetical protein